MPGVVADSALPTFGWSPPAASSFGAEAVDLAASAGLMLDPWQAYALDQILGEQEDGRPAVFEACLIVPRQNGKGSVLEALSLAWLFLTEAPLILHSAHEFKTAAEAFRRLRALIKGAAHLSRRVERVTTAAGNEAIELANGQRLRYVARSDKSAIGFTSGKLILDEAFAISAEEMAAMMPTLSTQREAQLVYTSTAGKAASSQLRSLRDRGRAGGDPGLCYLEWGGRVECPAGCRHELDADACGLNDRAVWAASNPSWEIYREDGTQGITEAYVGNERRSLVQLPEKFARERLGVWDAAPEDAVSPISAEAWVRNADPAGQVAGTPVLAVDVSPDRGSAAIGLCGRRGDGMVQVEVVRHGAGESWVLPELRSAREAGMSTLAMDGRSQAMALKADLEADGWTVMELGPADQVEACIGLQRDVMAGDRLRHLGDAVLARALAVATTRPVGDGGGWAWARKRSDGDITPLVAVTAARWALPQAEAMTEQQFFGAWR